MFESVLVANRGEIAVRVIRTLRALGIRSVAVYSDADAHARHVREADTAVRLGPAPARNSYLSVERVIDAARATGVDALHPGYGFLAESPALAEACAAANVTFVGPPPSAIHLMGDKMRARRTVAAVGVPVVPGADDPGMTDDDLVAAAEVIGYPLLLKPSAGGGGKGMRRVDDPGALAGALAASRREAESAFGDDALLVEHFVTRPRHIEIQVLADGHGGIVHLGERECSLQRRHQKVIEETPSPFVDAATRAAMGAQAIAAARACEYTNAGTVEFVVPGDAPGTFFFIEMNTRLQVEHPVTELVTGLDLVEWQLRIAAGEALPWSQGDLAFTGHAIEARVYAEDPDRDFLPTGGTVLVLREPRAPDIRVDSALRVGDVVSTHYDPMLSKVVAWGEDRATARRRLDRALADTAVLGVPNNIGFLRRLLDQPAVAAGELDTGLVERVADALAAGPPPAAVLAAGALVALGAQAARPSAGTWDARDGWRLGGRASTTLRVGDADVELVAHRDSWLVRVDGSEPVPVVLSTLGDRTLVDYAGRVTTVDHFRDGPTLWIGAGGDTWMFDVTELGHGWPDTVAAGTFGPVVSPMPGSVVAVLVVTGQHVVAGAPLAIVEAMKMEHTVTAGAESVVTGVHVVPGQQVALGESLVTLGPREPE
jgi:acetyl-CoA/propionyl-CoA carboxylase biotin carboxyl carrier protein